MKCKIEKYIYLKSADIFLRNVEFNDHTLACFTGILKSPYAALLFDDCTEKDLDALLCEHGVREYSRRRNNEVLAVVSTEKLTALLCVLLQEGTSNILLFDLYSPDEPLAYSRLEPRHLIKNATAGITIGIIVDENEVDISFAKDRYCVNDVMACINSICA